jgi:hypothetical protein
VLLCQMVHIRPTSRYKPPLTLLNIPVTGFNNVNSDGCTVLANGWVIGIQFGPSSAAYLDHPHEPLPLTWGPAPSSGIGNCLVCSEAACSSYPATVTSSVSLLLTLSIPGWAAKPDPCHTYTDSATLPASAPTALPLWATEQHSVQTPLPLIDGPIIHYYITFLIRWGMPV